MAWSAIYERNATFQPTTSAVSRRWGNLTEYKVKWTCDGKVFLLSWQRREAEKDLAYLKVYER